MQQNLTEKQKEQFAELSKEARKVGQQLSRRMVFILLLGLLAVNVLNQLFVQNDWFVISMCFVTGLLVMKDTNTLAREKREYFREKVNKILADK